MQTCTKRWADVPFAHRQPAHPGHCRYLHGHGWCIEVEFSSTEKDKSGFIVDFGGDACKEMKRYLDNHFDHKCVLSKTDPLVQSTALNNLESVFSAIKVTLVDDCSCEGLAAHFFLIFGEILRRCEGDRSKIERVTVWEDSKNSATFRPDSV